MSIGAEVYRALTEGDDPSSGDIACLTLARTREIAVDAIFALVVTHSCEIDRQKNRGADEGHRDCRLTVAPIVPESRVRPGDGAAAESAHGGAAAGPAGQRPPARHTGAAHRRGPPARRTGARSGPTCQSRPSPKGDRARLRTCAGCPTSKGDRVAVALTADDGTSITVELIAR